MIELKNLTKSYPPGQKALDNLSLKLAWGDFTFIAGASGAGKSTLLRILFGELKPTSGEAIVNSYDLNTMTPSRLPYYRREVGFVFQDFKLLKERSVLDNVTFPLEVQGVPKFQRDEIGHDLLKMVQLEDKALRNPEALSGGEQQRVAVLRALIHCPKILLADEPTGNLDPKMSDRIFQLLARANDAGVTVIVASHDLTMMEKIGYRTVVLDRGRVVGDYKK